MKLIFSTIVLTQISYAAMFELTFKAETTMPGVEVTGKFESPLAINLEEKPLKVTLPISKLVTGMEIRDQHMREEVFANQDIKIKIDQENLKQCAQSSNSEMKTQLTLRGVDKIVSTQCRKSGESHQGSLILNLKDFNITPPSKFGVAVKETVLIEFNVTR